jgi:ABC-type dipeptide/oligopeptide/nickel transport system permease component
MLFLARRLAQGVLVVVGVMVIVFVLLHLTGNPAAILLPDQATAAQVAAVTHNLGLDQPLGVQFVKYMQHALRGDFGESLYYRQPAMSLVLSHLPNSAILAAVAMGIAAALALPMGILAALYRGRFVDRMVMTISLVGYAVPTFWLAIMLILVFSVTLGWLPPSGFDSPKSLILPGLTLGLYEMALLSRLLRRGLVDAYGRDYIRTARAKGMGESSILATHAMKNALIPVITVFGLQLGALIGGAVITETIFAYPGVGYLVVQAIYQRDFPIVEAFVVVSATIIVLVNIGVDLLYGVLDPRVRYA